MVHVADIFRLLPRAAVRIVRWETVMGSRGAVQQKRILFERGNLRLGVGYTAVPRHLSMLVVHGIRAAGDGFQEIQV